MIWPYCSWYKGEATGSIAGWAGSLGAGVVEDGSGHCGWVRLPGRGRAFVVSGSSHHQGSWVQIGLHTRERVGTFTGV